LLTASHKLTENQQIHYEEPVHAVFSALARPALAPGEVQLRLPDGGTYIGTVSNGVPDGKGYFKDADGSQYEGEVRMGQRTGVADGMFPKGDRYQGEWKNGKPDGIGRMTYMLGGAYEGEWKNGRRHGKGRSARISRTRSPTARCPWTSASTS
jgi:hypothetical protein